MTRVSSIVSILQNLQLLCAERPDGLPADVNQRFQPFFERLPRAQPVISFDFLFRAPPPRRQEAKEVKAMAVLEHQQFDTNTSEEKECNICRVEFLHAEHIMRTTCCGTKYMHINCAVNCLRQSEMCPFCRGSKISF